jgi:hypothetical protein
LLAITVLPWPTGSAHYQPYGENLVTLSDYLEFCSAVTNAVSVFTKRLNPRT